VSLDQASKLAKIVVALVGLPGQLWMLYRVCQMAKIIRRHAAAIDPSSG
jgi:uncharacterized membrane protein YuzA (DUF378 family)